MPRALTFAQQQEGAIALRKTEMGRSVPRENGARETSVMAHGRDGSPAPPVPTDWIPAEATESGRDILYVHGGSFIVGPSPRIMALVGRIAAETRARVFMPRYRLAPEHPCPAAVDDIVASYRWHRARWPKREMFAIAEISGAAILLAALQVVRDAGEPLPAGIVLLSPWVDLSLQSWSVVEARLTGSYPYAMEHSALMVHLYLQGLRSATDPIASPLFGDFEGFPPFLIHAHKSDIVFDDAVRLAERVNAGKRNAQAQLLVDDAPLWEQMHSVRQLGPTMAQVAKFIEDRSDDRHRK